MAQRPIFTPDRRLRVFVSSTLRELALERMAASEAISSLHLAPVLFEQGARPVHLALSALREERVTVAELASRLGYRSEAAFSRAFKRVVGVPPGACDERRSTRRQPLRDDVEGAAPALVGALVLPRGQVAAS